MLLPSASPSVASDSACGASACASSSDPVGLTVNGTRPGRWVPNAFDRAVEAATGSPLLAAGAGEGCLERRRIEAAGLIRAAYGHALLESKRNSDAIRAFQRALREEPRQSFTHHLLAIAYGRSGQEGLSRLHLAEEAILKNKGDIARTEANLALQKLEKSSAGAQRARDILDLLDKKKKNEG